MNGDVVKHNGLVTPPSPRSQSSDSGRYRRRRRRNREGRRESEGEESSGSEGEEGERSPSPSAARRGVKEGEGSSAKEVRGKEETSESTAPTSAASSLGVVTGKYLLFPVVVYLSRYRPSSLPTPKLTYPSP